MSKILFHFTLGAILVLYDIHLQAQTFTGILIPELEGINCYYTDWGDYDNDGDFDLLLIGYTSDSHTRISQVWRNEGNDSYQFQPTISLEGMEQGIARWFDFNNDLLLDIILIGSNGGNARNRIYYNNGDNTFTESVILEENYNSVENLNLSDYDNDGDIDILLSRYSGINIIRNENNGNYKEITGFPFSEYTTGNAYWTDFNNDNYLDLIIAGKTANGTSTELYYNNGKEFKKDTSYFKGYHTSTIASADYNCDGKLDFIISGYTDDGDIASSIYKNLGNNRFIEVEDFFIIHYLYSPLKWADFDNDGDLDIVSLDHNNLYVYRNDENDIFTDINFSLEIAVANINSLSVVDVDNDGDLDICISWVNSSNFGYFSIYKNDISDTNVSPSPPDNLYSQIDNSIATLNWSSVKTDETPYLGLTYNLMLGSTENGYDLLSPQSDISGVRKIVAEGNIGLDTSYALIGLPPGSYFWKIQAIDNLYQGSPFSESNNFTISTIAQARNIILDKITGNKALIQWQRGTGDKCTVFAREGDTSSIVVLDSIVYLGDNNFGSGSSIGNGWYCIYNGSNDSITLSGLQGNTKYTIAILEYTGIPGEEIYKSELTEYNTLTFSTMFFSELELNLTEVYKPSFDWGDFDEDGDFDLLITGSMSSKVYRNDAGSGLTLVPGILLEGVYFGCSKWVDYDNDSDLDIFICGQSLSGDISFLYMNQGGDNFELQTGIQFSGISKGAADWADFDNDGDLDLAICGSDLTKIYKNNGNNTFSEQFLIDLAEVRESSLKCCDYDNDGDIDIFIAGYGTNGIMTKLYRNDGASKFIEQSNFLFPGIRNGAIDLGDYDNDGDLDLLLAGSNVSKVFNNEQNNNFSENTTIVLPSLYEGTAIWMDYNHDGFLDILISGNEGSGSVYFSKIYRNERNGVFTELENNELSKYIQYAAAADFDQDGDLDIITNETRYNYINRLYTNNEKSVNSPPNSPTNLNAEIGLSTTKLSWNTTLDPNNEEEVLSYNVRVGTTPLGNEVISSHSSTGGFHKITSRGNAQLDTFLLLKNLPPNEYYWSVQSIDNSNVGSSFANEEVFLVDSIQSSDISAEIINDNTLLLRWIRGNGGKCILFGKVGTDGISYPLDSISYEADNQIGLGTEIDGSGWYCIYNGRADSAFVKGIVPGYSYVFHVLEYNGKIGDEQYYDKLSNSNHILAGTSLFLEKTRFSRISSGNHDIGDFNNDGFPDIGSLSIIPFGFFGEAKVLLLKNNGNLEFEEYHEFDGTFSGSLKWNDYDRDEKLDLILTGNTAPMPPIINYIYSFYRNDQFDTLRLDATTVFGTNSIASIDWADYDNDGDLDAFIAGTEAPLSFPTEIYTSIFKSENDTTLLNQDIQNLPGLVNGSIAWCDYNNDGHMDFAISGSYEIFNPTTQALKVFQNTGNNSFIEIDSTQFLGLLYGSIKWADYDKDGFSDFIICGLDSNAVETTILYHNDNGESFSNSEQNIIGVSYGSSAWGDYDNDGDLDIVISGINNNNSITKIYTNTGNGNFSELNNQSLLGFSNGRMTWCDLDNDGDLDLFIAGKQGTSNKGIIYQNCLINKSQSFPPNEAPSNPVGKKTQLLPNEILLSWDPVENDNTPKSTMSYNLKITKLDDADSTIINPLSSNSGFRQVSGIGNTGLNTFSRISDLQEGEYVWWVQAIDQGYKGSQWSDPDTFQVKNLQPFFTFDTVCQGFPTSFTDNSVSTDGIDSWLWDFGDGNTSSTQSPSYTFNTPGTHQVKLIIQSGTSKDSLSKEVLVLAKPTALFNADIACQGSSTTFNNTTILNGTTISSWNWDFGNGINTSDKESPDPVFYSSTGEYTVKLVARATNGCADSTENTAILAEYPSAIIATGVNPEFCQGDSIRLSVPQNSNYTYRWKIGVISIVDADSSVFYAKSTGAYDVSVTNTIGSCTSNSQESANIIVTPAPSQPYIQTDDLLTFCSGDSAVLSVTNDPEVRYQWKLNGGDVGSDTSVISAKSLGTYKLELKNSLGCSSLSSNSIDVTVKTSPAVPTVTPNGPKTFCLGGSVELSTDNSPTLSYQWLKGEAIITDATTSSYTAQASGLYKLKITNTNDCSTESQISEVIVNASPDSPTITYNGPEEFCEGDSLVLSTFNNPDLTYLWKVNSLSTGVTSNKFAAKSSGSYTLEISNSSDCKALSTNNVDVLVHDLPLKSSILSTGHDRTDCPGDKLITLAPDPAPNQYTYEWQLGGITLEGETAASLQDYLQPGSYSVKISNEGCSTVSERFLLDFESVPDKPQIIAEGPIVWYLVCSDTTAIDYQWYYNGQLIQGADENLYVVNQQYGKYEVSIAEKADGCYTKSDPVWIPLGTGIETNPWANLKIYPNPTPGLFTLEMDNPIMGKLIINIMNERGSQVLNIKFLKEMSHFQTQIDLSGQPSAVYIIGLLLEEYRASRRLIVE